MQAAPLSGSFRSLFRLLHQFSVNRWERMTKFLLLQRDDAQEEVQKRRHELLSEQNQKLHEKIETWKAFEQ